MATAPRILVTGASGFIGRHLVTALAHAGYQVRAAARHPVVFADSRIEGIALGDMSRSFAAEYLVRGMDAVVHAAGLAHANPDIPDAVYTAINVDATRQIAKAARLARMKHLVLMSSVRAQIGPSCTERISETSVARPTDAYGRSKLAAEAAVSEILGTDNAATSWTVLRPVLVYGPGVKGNMASLIRLADRPVPLPFGGLQSRRSLLGIENLIGAVQHVLIADAARNATYLVADDEALTLPEIVTALRAGLGRRPMLLPVPQKLFSAGLRLAKKDDLAERLLGGLLVDTSRLRATGWRAVRPAADGLAAAARGGAASGRH